MEHELEYSDTARRHLRAFERKHQRLLRAEIEEQLTFEPGKRTRNRKILKEPAWYNAEWELRCGPQNRFRVLYEIDDELPVVRILAIGVKEGSDVRFHGEED